MEICKRKRKKRNAPPDYSNLRAMNLRLCFVNVRDTLSKVELSVLFRCATFDLYEGGVGSGIALSTLVAEDATFGVESV